MNANQACDLLIWNVKTSNLNFVLEESPFSVNISLKKSFIKMKNGDPSPPGFLYNNSNGVVDSSYLNANGNIAKENEALKDHLKVLETDKEALEEAINNLGIKLEKSKVEICELLSDKNSTTKEKGKTEKKLAEKDTDT